MTRDEFWDEVTCWSDIKEIDYENELHLFDDVYDDDGRSEIIEEEISESNYDWKELRDLLDEIPDYDYYHRHIGFLEWEGVDDEVDSALQELFDELEANDYFEDDDEDDNVEELVDENIVRVANGYLFKKNDEAQDDFGTEQVDFGILVG